MKTWALSSLALGALLSLPGCIIVDDDDPPPLVGTLTVEWSIGGAQDPLDCIDFGVDRLELVISGPGEDIEVEAVCEDFITSVDLYEGRYVADATLVDSFDRAATLTQPIDDVDVIDGTELILEVDFPLGSFL
jgi:hypothetical protein